MKALTPLILAACCGLGLYFICTGIAGIREARQSAGWPTVTAMVSQVESQSGGSDIIYTYEVGSQQYQSSTIYPGQMPLKGRYYGNTYPKGTTFPIHYSPDDPSMSCLYAGIRPRTYLRLVFGTLIFSFGIFFTVVANLAPKYGKPDGRGGYAFGFGNPLGRFCLCGLAIIFAQFILLYFLDR